MLKRIDRIHDIISSIHNTHVVLYVSIYTYLVLVVGKMFSKLFYVRNRKRYIVSDFD